MSTTTTNTTNTESKQTIKADWQATKLQSEVLKTVATLYTSLGNILSKEDAKVIAEVNKTILINKDYYSGLEIKTPVDLANAIAQYTTNVLGIKVTTVTAANKATVVFEGGSLVSKLTTINNLKEDAAEKLIEAYKWPGRSGRCLRFHY